MNKIQKKMSKDQYLKVSISTIRDGKLKEISFDYKKREDSEKPMALDVLIQAQSSSIPDLAFRYGCRARNCGVCTIDINDKPRIACRARVRDGDKLSPIATLPVLADFVVKRDGISRQLRDIKLSGQANELNIEAPEEYHELTACIECYACLDKCPMHSLNFKKSSATNNINEYTKTSFSGGYEYGNPFSLLKLQRIILDPLKTEVDNQAALDKAIDLGLENCIKCPGCKCGVGIDLKGKVIKPLLNYASSKIKS